jgi:hypothetical protein
VGFVRTDQRARSSVFGYDGSLGAYFRVLPFVGEGRRRPSGDA